MKAKPGSLTLLGGLMIASGILNLLWRTGVIAGALGSIIGAICAPLGAYPFLVGVVEVIYGAKFLSTPTPGLKPPKVVAVLEICDIGMGNIVAFVVGILAFVFYGAPDVQAYFASLAPPAPPVPPEPPALAP